ncbi:MAG: leucine-rich repeat domain-containing protein [Oscillospiraceae bacterium]|nr:leucine-rich repeat domain-containing protein [Oscillospiraceae bacterium]
MKVPVCDLCGCTQFIKREEGFACTGCGTLYPREEAVKLLRDVSELGGETPAETQKAAVTDNPDFVVRGDVLEKYVGNDDEVTIPEGVRVILTDCFEDKHIHGVTIPDSVELIEADAFPDCDQLTYATVPGTLESRLSDAFFASELKEIGISYGSPIIHDHLFEDLDTVKIVWIPDSVTEIGEEAFCNCAELDELHMPDSVLTIGSKAFAYCEELSEITVPDSVQYISEDAFKGCIVLDPECTIVPVFPDLKSPLFHDAGFKERGFCEWCAGKLENGICTRCGRNTQ